MVVEGSGKAAYFIVRKQNTRNAQAKKSKKMKIGPLIVANCAWARCIYISCVHLLAFTSSNQVECKYLNAKFKHCFGTNVAVSAAVPQRGFAETSYCVLRPQGGRHHLQIGG